MKSFVPASILLGALLLASCRHQAGAPSNPPATAARPDRTDSQASLSCPATMVKIPGGQFDSEIEVSDFCMDKLEVSVKNYQLCVDAGRCPALPPISYGTYPGPGSLPIEDTEKYPINMTTRMEAIQYCEWRGDRLPTAEEWLWAARGRDEQRGYPWGNDERPGAMCKPFPGETPPCAIGTSPEDRTRDGVLDMGGNVSEWTSTIVRGEAYSFGDATVTFPPKKKPPDARAFDGFRCARSLRARD